MGKLTEYMTAAGLSAMLLITEASGQQAQQQVDLKTIQANRVVVQVGGRSVFNTASMPTNTVAATPGGATTTPQQPSRPVNIGNVEDCLTASSNYVKTAAAPAAAPAATTTAPQRSATRAERGSGSRPAAAGSASQAFIATCYKDGKPVAKITFATEGDPLVELIPDAPTTGGR